jgi:putative hydrolase of the HAD superfamily
LTLDEAALVEAARRYALPIREGLVAADGAAATLAALREAGYRIGLISNTIWPAELHIEDLEEIGLLHYLEHLTFSGEIGIWKPNRQIFQHALDALGVAPEHAVFVGDSPREDIVGAHAAGMRAIWIRSREFPLGDVQPDAMIETLPELLPILEHWHA